MELVTFSLNNGVGTLKIGKRSDHKKEHGLEILERDLYHKFTLEKKTYNIACLIILYYNC